MKSFIVYNGQLLCLRPKILYVRKNGMPYALEIMVDLSEGIWNLALQAPKMSYLYFHNVCSN